MRTANQNTADRLSITDYRLLTEPGTISAPFSALCGSGFVVHQRLATENWVLRCFRWNGSVVFGDDTRKNVSRVIGFGAELGSGREPLRAGKWDGLFGDPRDAQVVGVNPLSQRRSVRVLLRPHRAADLAASQRV